MVTTAGFSKLAVLAGKAAGIANLPYAEYPGPVGIHDIDEIRRNVGLGLVERVVEGLTRERAFERDDAGAVDPERSVFSGDFDQVNEHFLAQGWTDRLPVVPPTADRIRQFLRFTSRPAHDLIGVLPSGNLQATPWNVAANAIMAGCRPEHMPILVAATEALADERAGLNMLGTSSGLIPFLVVNGPVATDLGIVGDAHLVSRGANPVLGRAIGLIIRNVAGFREGTTHMGTFGYPLAFVVAEYEAASPWAPFSVDQGFAPGESTVTFGVTNNWGPGPGAASTEDQGGADTALEMMRREICKKVRLYNYPGIGPDAEHVMITVLMTPSVARSLAAAGYGKDDVKRHLHEHTTIRTDDFEWILRHYSIMRGTLREKVAQGLYPASFLGPPDAMVNVLSSPDIVHIVVCGDPNRNRLMVLEGAHTRPTTRRVEWPPR